LTDFGAYLGGDDNVREYSLTLRTGGIFTNASNGQDHVCIADGVGMVRR